MATAATRPALIPAAVQPAAGKECADEEVRQLAPAREGHPTRDQIACRQ